MKDDPPPKKIKVGIIGGGNGALTQAERIRQEIADLEFAQADSVTASFGFARYRENDTAGSLLKRADEAMYKAKSGGKKRVAVDDRLNPAWAA